MAYVLEVMNVCLPLRRRVECDSPASLKTTYEALREKNQDLEAGA